MSQQRDASELCSRKEETDPFEDLGPRDEVRAAGRDDFDDADHALASKFGYKPVFRVPHLLIRLRRRPLTSCSVNSATSLPSPSLSASPASSPQSPQPSPTHFTRAVAPVPCGAGSSVAQAACASLSLSPRLSQPTQHAEDSTTPSPG